MLAIAKAVPGSELPQSTEEQYVAPLPLPITAPVPAPLDPYIQPAPMLATAPDGQTRGEGGTPYGSVPVVYFDAPVLKYGAGVGDDSYTDQMPERSPNPATSQPVERAKDEPGRVAPIPTTPPPSRIPAPKALDPVQKPAGPITGNVAGFDLATVPLWAWLAGAALLGSRLLK